MKKLLIPFLILVGLNATFGQKEKFIVTFDHFAINVRDLDRSVDFYQTFLFLEEIYDGTEKEHIRWFSLGNNQELHIISVPELEISIPKGVHMAVSIKNFQQYLLFLSENKIKYYDWPGASGKFSIRPDGIKQIYIQDPDGYWIEINDGIKRFNK